jgi:hypothetical protein
MKEAEEPIGSAYGWRRGSRRIRIRGGEEIQIHEWKIGRDGSIQWKQDDGSNRAISQGSWSFADAR